MNIEDYIATVQGVEISHHIRRDCSHSLFLVPKSLAPLESWEAAQAERETELFYRAIVAGMIVVTALWLWVLGVGVHWLVVHVWQAVGHEVWVHLLGGALSMGDSV